MEGVSRICLFPVTSVPGDSLAGGAQTTVWEMLVKSIHSLSFNEHWLSAQDRIEHPEQKLCVSLLEEYKTQMK